MMGQATPCLWWGWPRTPKDGDTEADKAWRGAGGGCQRSLSSAKVISFRATEEEGATQSRRKRTL